MLLFKLCLALIENENEFFLTTLVQLSRLEQIHNRGVIHRDIKPENFVLKPVAKNRKPLRKCLAEKERDEISSSYPH